MERTKPTEADLQKIPLFADMTENVKQWLIEKGEVIGLEEGEMLFKPGDPVNELLAHIDGKVQAYFSRNGQRVIFSTFERGNIYGLLPYSRMQEVNSYGVALSASRIYSLNKQHFREMEDIEPSLIQTLVSMMTDRVRDYTRSQQQNDKMMALGKLSAGLAHELNNPVAAISRTVQQLEKRLDRVNDAMVKLAPFELSPGQLSPFVALAKDKASCAITEQLSALERSECEDEWADWLEKQGMADGYRTAGTFVDNGIRLEDVEKSLEDIESEAVLPMVEWFENITSTHRLLAEVSEASGRISELVRAMKDYSHMDRAVEKEALQVTSGINSTLTILHYKLRKKNIEVVRNFDESLPAINGYTGELNQVWTNLIDNAIDALPEDGGEIEIKTEREGGTVMVRIIDNGPGIPEDIQGKIFDPFFSTKPVGQGTGLGLDIVQRIITKHEGQVKLKSQPGRTEFVVCFPVAENAS